MSKGLQVCVALGGIIAFVVLAMALETFTGVPFDTTYRFACAAGCLLFIAKLGYDAQQEHWLRVSLGVALLVNIAIFFTPLVDRPAARGEIMVFALPDAIVLMAARLISLPRATDAHGRAVRQQVILGLILAILACSVLPALMLIHPHSVH